MKLTKRLETALAITPMSRTIADVGTDHGYLAVALVEMEKAHRVIAIDVNEGPLQSAQAYVEEQNMTMRVECRLGNGLTVTEKGEIDGAIMCGMGGFLMKDIIESGPELLPYYVLQPQNGRRELRQWLVKAGYGITDERLVYEGRHFYDVWLVEKNQFASSYYAEVPLASVQWEVGGLAGALGDPLWKAYVSYLITRRQRVLRALKSGAESAESAQKMVVVAGELEELEEML